MDPTKPILGTISSIIKDLDNDFRYNDCFYKEGEGKIGKSRRQKMNYEQRCLQLEQQNTILKQQYQKLYQAYNERYQHLKEYDQLVIYTKELEAKILNLEKYSNSHSEISILRQKNEQLKNTLLNKNYQLQQAYRKLQSYSTKSQNKSFNESPSPKKVFNSIQRFEDGIKQAIYSNFELLKNNSINEIRGLIRNARSSTTTFTEKLIHTTI